MFLIISYYSKLINNILKKYKLLLIGKNSVNNWGDNMGIEEKRQEFLKTLSNVINYLQGIMECQKKHDFRLMGHLLSVNCTIENGEYQEQKLLLYESQVSYLIKVLKGREEEVNDYIQKLQDPRYTIDFKEDYQTLPNVEKEISALNEEIKQAEERDAEILKELECISKKKRQKEHELQNLKELKAKVDKELEGQEEVLERQTIEIKDKNEEFKKLHKEVKSKSGDLVRLNNKILSAQDELKEIEQKINSIQQRLRKIEEEEIEKKQVLRELDQELASRYDRITDMTTEMQNRLNAVESDSDSESEQLTLKRPQPKRNLVSLEKELQEDASQCDSYWEDSIRSLQGSTISSTTQEEMLSKETQTLNMQYSRTMGYIVFFTIPFSLIGISLTVVPLVKSTENNTIFLSLGLSFSALAIVCVTAVALYNHYSEPAADLALPEKLSNNSIYNTVIQDCSMSKT